jgi:predicted transcriptional regulator
MSTGPTSTESRALELLGQGIGPEMVASALGVTTSAISQLLAREDFALAVTERRFQSLAAHNTRDLAYDKLEDKLLEKLENVLPMMFDPLKILRALQVINGAKRRGAAAPDSTIQKQQIVQLVMPSVALQQFTQTNNLTMNIHNQVVNAGGQDLITVQSANMDKLLGAARSAKSLTYESQPNVASSQPG